MTAAQAIDRYSWAPGASYALRAPEWAIAEDAFLGPLCRIRVFPYGACFTSEHEARRMNSLRVLDVDALAADEWRAVLAEHAQAFAARGMPFTLQMAEPATPATLPYDWQSVGPVLVHVATDLRDFAAVSSIRLDLRPVTNDDDVRVFTDMTIPDRVPEPLREVARPGILRSLRAFVGDERIHPLLAYDGDALVAQVALMASACGYSVSNLTVNPSHRGKGYMKAIYAALSRRFEGPLHGQIIDGVATLAFRDKLPSTRRLAVTRTYQRLDDPFLEPAS